MESLNHPETFESRRVRYVIELDGKVYIVENVPARVCVETGEELFAPETVEALRRIILGNSTPKAVVETPVFEFAA